MRSIRWPGSQGERLAACCAPAPRPIVASLEFLADLDAPVFSPLWSLANKSLESADLTVFVST